MEVDDVTLRGMVAKFLESCSGDQENAEKEAARRVIETAGGVPAPGLRVLSNAICTGEGFSVFRLLAKWLF